MNDWVFMLMIMSVELAVFAASWALLNRAAAYLRWVGQKRRERE